VKDREINFDPENLVFNTYFIHLNLNEEAVTPQTKRIMVKNTLIKLKRVRN
jgi:hypothetical protein